MNSDTFRQYLLVRRGLQPITADGYVGAYKRWSKVLGDYPTHEAIEKYVYVMYESKYSYTYKKNTILAIEHYTEFLGLPIKLGRQKRPRSIVKNTLTESEVSKLIFCCKNLKEKAIVAMLAYSGIRNRELCTLRVRDFDAGRNALQIIQGKGLKDGVSMVAPECTQVLLHYIQEYKKLPDDFFFTTYQGNQYTGFALRKRVKVIAKRAKIEKRVFPHLLRHSLAVNMVIRGADIITLKNQLRHSILETTLQYLNSIVFSERNAYDKISPSYL